MGRSEVSLLHQDCYQVPALPYHPVMGSSNSAWQSTQPLHDPVQRVLVDEMGGWSFDAAVQGLLGPAQLRPYDGGMHNVYREA